MMFPNVAIRRWTDTTPAGRPLLSVTTSDHLDLIERFMGVRPTISDCTMSCRMHPDSAVIDGSPSARLDGNRTIAGEIISQFFKDGVADADYILTYLVTFSDGSKEPFDAMISVRKFIGM